MVVNNIILADSEAIFQKGTAKVLALDEEFCIVARCADLERMMHAIVKFPGAILLFASSLHPNMPKLMMVLESARSRAIVIAENKECASEYILQGFRGVIGRSVTGTELVKCVRRVALGGRWVQPRLAIEDQSGNDTVGMRVRDRLTPKEMCIVAFVVQGFKNRAIAIRLGTTEQVIKNHLRLIYNKTCVGDRLELALFTLHHRVLAQAATEMGRQLEDEEQQAAPTSVA